jgi:hypothetical protein
VKITFEGKTHQDIFDQMESLLASTNMSRRQASMADEFKNVDVAQAQGPGPDPVPQDIVLGDKPVENPVSKTPKARTAKQLENDARLRERAASKKKAAPPAPAQKTLDELMAEDEAAKAKATKVAEETDPAKVVAIRQKTIEDLQSAYANGHQQEVFDLLSRFGNGAKSFRELPPEAFMPIREAIDNGALA